MSSFEFKKTRSEDGSVSLIPSLSCLEKKNSKKKRKTRSEDGSVSLIPSTLSLENKNRKKKRKKQKTTTTPESISNPSLPEDLLLNCLARVSRLYYPALSLVSKSFRSLLASPELYKARSLLGHTENCLYVCFRSLGEDFWYTLCLKPNQTLTSQNKSSGYALAAVPVPHSPGANVSGLVAVGSNVYNIGSHRRGVQSSRVSILDCQSHTWHEGPSLPVELLTLSANVLDEKIYVAGCYKDGHSLQSSHSLKSSFKVFDTKTQIWDPNPIPFQQIETSGIFRDTSACVDGKFFVEGFCQAFAYLPKEGRWDLDEECDMWLDIVPGSSHCVIDNVLYCGSDVRDRVHRGFKWFDVEGNMWRDLKGLVGLPKFRDGAKVTFGEYGGKMVAKLLQDKKQIKQLVDTSLGDEYNREELIRLASTAFLCMEQSSLL
ncbi:hypothetical protein AALP_AA1G049900 [Arabis alpina]|uniref:F-box domain-containing protein n=1 Tax=Arabis alpina TaxID=50452 RepID=A0A087HL71_ARAAL|nr:hypothetical protein AALP_AA1G049900 [Arabis alpina]